MIVISNASPLIALSQAGVHILRDLFQSVLITSDVLRYADDFGLIDFQTVVDKLHNADMYLPGV